MTSRIVAPLLWANREFEVTGTEEGRGGGRGHGGADDDDADYGAPS